MKVSKWKIFKYKWLNKHCRHFCFLCKFRSKCDVKNDLCRLDGREAEMIIEEYNKMWLARAKNVEPIKMLPFLYFLHDRGLLDMDRVYELYKNKCVPVKRDTGCGTTYK